MLEKLSTLEDVQELYKWFGHMRAQQPTWFDESSSCWHVFRYNDVSRVMTDLPSSPLSVDKIVLSILIELVAV